ncbi:hypothetical protein ebA3247 [Aromatoleum aromaticum EbN1]|uniref:Uncharacterized protein n=1 Tax=Aromatoleum aromaticum (strain DSM 19018 / LMG 30748 / EbN1) TaxID=76114 RepID=Q5P411_AROAE|nr:hypothetical protein ebA3247 [Aromatoleum aromaticum EbN1]
MVCHAEAMAPDYTTRHRRKYRTVSACRRTPAVRRRNHLPASCKHLKDGAACRSGRRSRRRSPRLRPCRALRRHSRQRRPCRRRPPRSRHSFRATTCRPTLHNRWQRSPALLPKHRSGCS